MGISDELLVLVPQTYLSRMWVFVELYTCAFKTTYLFIYIIFYLYYFLLIIYLFIYLFLILFKCIILYAFSRL